MSVLLQVENLSAGYVQPGSKVIAARDITFQLRPRRVYGFSRGVRLRENYLGLRNCRPLAASWAGVSGRVLFNGQDLGGLSEEELRKLRWKEMSIVMQASMNVLNPVMRVRHQFYDVMRTHFSAKRSPAFC